jgi:hypothetical protein
MRLPRDIRLSLEIRAVRTASAGRQPLEMQP